MRDPLPEDAVVGVVAVTGERRDASAALDADEVDDADDADEVVDAVVAHLAATGRSPVVDTAEAVLAHDPAIVIAVGEPALLSLVPTGVNVSVLPVGAGRGVRSVPAAGPAVEEAVDRIVAGDWTTVERPVVGARPSGGRALLDLMVATAEPARISEYSVRFDDVPIARFRGDGVVVATPAGSLGYARAAGGPVTAPESGAVVVVPVGVFATDSDTWVVPVDTIELTVHRDETPVELRADGRTVGRVAPDDPVTFRVEDTLAVAVVEESRSFWKHSNGSRTEGNAWRRR